MGVYKYASDPAFEILLLAFKIDDGPTELLDLTDPDAMDYFETLLTSADYRKIAFNAPFERACLAAFFKLILDPAQWECTLARAYVCGMSGGLDHIAGILKIGNKLQEGKMLIRFFCMDCKPTKANGGRYRNLREHAPDKWLTFEEYCMKDVDLEHQVYHKLKAFPSTETERAVWILDQQINDRGVQVDIGFIEATLAFDAYHSQEVFARARALTGLDNPKATGQLKEWLEAEMNTELESLRKEKIPGILALTDSKLIHEVMELRQQMAKTSIKKYVAMQRVAMADGRARGLLQYGGASRTGRWAGRGIQVHNLPKNEMDDLDLARRLVRELDYDTVDMCFNSIPTVLSQLIRTAFVPAPGKIFRVSDFAAIEARVIAWLAGETWRLDVFTSHGKIYEASAAAMFSVPIDSIKKGSDLRQAGKVAELALGYQGAVGALTQMLTQERSKAYFLGKKFDYNPTEAQLKELVDRWRRANPWIVQLWYAVQEAAMQAVQQPGSAVRVNAGGASGCLSFQVKANVLFMTLPSGRKLCYLRPRIIDGKFGDCLSYEGMEQGKKVWGRTETYGGKLVENAVQAIARDILAYAMLRVDAAGFDIVLHVHDEIVIEEPAGAGSVEILNDLMKQPVEWAPGLPLGAESFETYYYKKE